MTRLTEPDELSGLSQFEEFRDTAARWVKRASELLRGQLDFVDNVRAAGPFNVALSTTGNTVINHELGVIPRGVIAIEQAVAGQILTVAKTAQSITLRGTANFSVTILVI